jgi:hypothetical protein
LFDDRDDHGNVKKEEARYCDQYLDNLASGTTTSLAMKRKKMAQPKNM